jgi:predicted HTH transcriptional regulator
MRKGVLLRKSCYTVASDGHLRTGVSERGQRACGAGWRWAQIEVHGEGVVKSLEEAFALGEGVDVEVKEAQGRDGLGGLPRSFWETYSAFANTEGGLILLGVREEKDGSLTPVGLRECAKVRRELWNGLNNPQTISRNLLRERDVEVVESSGVQMLRVEIPRATRQQRPVYVGTNPLTGAFRRGFEGDFRCDEATVRRMIAEATEETRDAQILEGFDVADLDAESLAAYRNEFRSTKPGHPWISLDDRDFLERVGAWRRDRATQKAGLTIAGLLMFGQLRAILDAVPYYLIDYQEQAPKGSDQRWADRVTTDGVWSGNLFEFYRRVFQKLTADLKTPFRIEDGSRRIDESHVHEALREALVNTLIHADYSGRIGILVVKGFTGYLFRNPGTLRIPLWMVWAGGSSDCRNRTLQKMFQFIGVSEQAGSGIPKILRAWREQDWRHPLVVENMEVESTLLHLPVMSLLPQEAMDELDQLFGDDFHRLDETERLAVATALLEGRVTNERLRDITDAHPRDLTTLLRSLVDRGFLAQVGVGRGTRYHIPDRGQSSHIAMPSLFDAVRADIDGSEHLEARSEHLEARSEHLEGENDLVTAVRTSKKVDSDRMRQAILSLCQAGFRSLAELSAALNRAPDTLRTHYLNDMIQQGALVFRYPDKPNHPEQGYKAVDTLESTQQP